MREESRIGTAAGTSTSGSTLSAVQRRYATVANMTKSENGFNYVGTDSLGERIKGYVQTTDPLQAAKELERAGITLESLKEKRQGRKVNRRPTSVELATLAEQFGDLMEIGESPTQVCRLLAYNQSNQMTEDALLDAGEKVINGWTLSEAFSAQKDAKGAPLFPETFICAMRIGEEVGTATDADSGKTRSAFLLTLHRFAEAEKKADAIRSSIRSALLYPIAVIVFCLIAVAIVLYFVMPQMELLYSTLLEGTNAQLPLVTRIMIGASNLVTSWWGIGLTIILVFAVIAGIRWARTPEGSGKIKVMALRIPVFGPFFRHYYSAQVLRTLAMLASGIPSMTERFLVAAETSTNPEYKKMLMHVRHRFMTESTDLHKLFIPYTFLMGKEFSGVLMTFERTADMQGTFHNYANVVETRAERDLNRVLFWLQNFSIVPVGIFVGFILVAIYSPMFELGSRIGQ